MIPQGSDTIVTMLPKGMIIAGEFAYSLQNRNYRGDGSVIGVIYCSAYSAGAPYVLGMGPCLELARRGYPVVCGDCGDTPSKPLATDGPGSWGTDANQAKMTLYKNYLQGPMGAKAGKIIVVYGSHGGSLAYAWSYANQSSVACIAGAIGTVDVEDIRANNLGGSGGFQASIESRYGSNTIWQTARPTHNPVELVSSLTAIPQLDYYSTTDPICLPASHALLLTNAGGALTQRSLGAIGHTTNGLGGRSTQTTDFCDWVEAQLS